MQEVVMIPENMSQHIVNMKHDANGCYQCDKIALEYITALKIIKQNDPIPCSNDLFEFVWQITNLILSHREYHTYHYLPWFDLVTTELWDLAKQLKEQSLECDSPVYIRRNSVHSVSSQEDEADDEEENYRRAIRITVYNCRALVCEQVSNIHQAIVYYRKCASVKPTPFEPQQHLQYSALKSLVRLFDTDHYDSNSTTTNSSASVSSDSSVVTCTCCGVEKAYMPVCSRCKAQPYCSIRCMKSHHSIHSQTCCIIKK